MEFSSVEFPDILTLHYKIRIITELKLRHQIREYKWQNLLHFVITIKCNSDPCLTGLLKKQGSPKCSQENLPRWDDDISSKALQLQS